MTTSYMLELTDCLDCVVRDHGDGSIRVLVWGSLNANPQCWVRLYGSGKMLVVDQSDLVVYGNPSDERDGKSLPVPWPKEEWVCVCAAETPIGQPPRHKCGRKEVAPSAWVCNCGAINNRVGVCHNCGKHNL